jgi:ribosomal protein RSM22 (predicted rRNA methylase)
VGQRALVGTPYLGDPDLRGEYAREIAPRTTVALRKILGELYPDAGARALGRPRRMLDLGAGTGAAGRAVRDHFDGEIDVVAVDLVVAAGGSAAERVHRLDVTDHAALQALGGPFDLVVAAHVLNELYVGEAPERRLARLGELTRRWCERLVADGGVLLLLEPALRETSRVLLAVRDRLLADGMRVVAPCFFAGHCPALVRPRDWCHDSAPAIAEAPHQDGGGGGGDDDDKRAPARSARVDFSYLALRAAGDPAAAGPDLVRIVSDPLVEKGRLRLYACGGSGRHALVRLDRHASPLNADLDRLVRGDVASVSRTAFAQDSLRIGPITAVTRRQPSGESESSKK